MSEKLDYRSDYPLSEKRPDLVNTAKGRPLDEITLEAVMSGEIGADEMRVTPEILEYQAQVAESVGRPQLAGNFRRAAELTRVSDERIMEIYNAMRPNVSTREELLAIADELENDYQASINASLVRDAVDAYERRGRLRQPDTA
ncbi:diol dehydratase small subunit [uncultured Salinisphaera sp.]|uniref:diol dehydratase small subunit n=1 Tax=uncultured Salinisphaera sp. TaxID=359372 RepID=UPI0032B2B14F|tara:strand:- start:3903 stop:4334 length:432 start_codon:yes stop_codon:yes gene_type:complete